MEILIALAHIVGSFLAVVIWHLLSFSYLKKRQLKAFDDVRESIALKLGIGFSDLAQKENSKEVYDLMVERFSGELFRNRVADLFGSVNLIVGYASSICQLIVYLAVIWLLITGSHSEALYSWFSLLLAISYSFFAFFINSICKILTGREPGQPNHVRRNLQAYIRNKPFTAS